MSGRLSRKRKPSSSGPENAVDSLEHDISNDFSSNSVLFRAPKKLKKSAEDRKNCSIFQYVSKVQTDKENLSVGVSNCNDATSLQEVIQLEDSDDESPLPKIAKKAKPVPAKSRKKNLSSKIVQQASVQSIFSKSVKSATASRSNTDSSYFTEVTGEDHQFLIDLEKSVCTENEKLCPSCKHIIEVSQFQSHIKTCLKKFSRTKVGTRSNVAQGAIITEDAEVESTPIAQVSSQPSSSQSSKRIATLVGGQFVVKSNEKHDILDPTFYLEEKVLSSCMVQGKRAVALQPTLGTKGALIYPKVAPSVAKRKTKSSAVTTLLMSVSERERDNRLKLKVEEIAAKTRKRDWNSEETIKRPEMISDFDSQEKPLWQISSSDKGDIEQYYVSALAPYVSVPSLEAQMNITLHRNLSQIPGRMNLTKAYDSEDEDHYESNVSVGPFTNQSGDTTQQVLAQLLASQSFFNMTYEAACKKEEGTLSKSSSQLQNSLKSNQQCPSQSAVQVQDKQTKISNEIKELHKEDCVAKSELDNTPPPFRKKEESVNNVNVEKSFTKKISTMSPNKCNEDVVKVDNCKEVARNNLSVEKMKVELNSNSSIKTELFHNEDCPSSGKSSKTVLFEAVNDSSSDMSILPPPRQNNVTDEEDKTEDGPKDSISNSPFTSLASKEEIENKLCDTIIARDSNGSATVLHNVEAGVTTPVPDTDSSDVGSFLGTPEMKPFQVAPLSCLSRKNLKRFNSLQDTIQPKSGSQSSGFLMDKFFSQLPPEGNENVRTETMKINVNRENDESLSQNFSNDWAKMLDNEDTSDVIITTETASISAHSLVLMVRCARMFNEIQTSKGNPKSIHCNCSYDSVYHFLKYVYSGQFNPKKLTVGNLKQVEDLALKYKCHDLLFCINSHQLINPIDEKCDSIKIDNFDANGDSDNKTTSSFLLEAFETKSKIEIKSNDPAKHTETNLKSSSNDNTTFFGQNRTISESVKNTSHKDDLYNDNEKTVNIGEESIRSNDINTSTVFNEVEDIQINTNNHEVKSKTLPNIERVNQDDEFDVNLSSGELQRSHSPDLFGNDFPDRDGGESDETDIFKEVKNSVVVDLSQSDDAGEVLNESLESPQESPASAHLSNTEIEMAEKMSVCSKVDETEAHISNVWDDFENLGGDYMAMDELPDIEPPDVVTTSDKTDFDSKVVESNVRLNSTVLPATDGKSLNMSASCPNVSRISSGIANQIKSPAIEIREKERKSTDVAAVETIEGIRNVITDDSLARLQDEMANDWEDEDCLVMESDTPSGTKFDNIPSSNRSEASRKDISDTSFRERISALCKPKGISPLPMKRVQELKEADAKTTPPNKRCPTMDSNTSTAQDSSFAVTPNPDYNAMNTPDIKNALEQYGIRPMARNKARKLLQHIYEQTHPVASDAETSYAEESISHQRDTEVVYNEEGVASDVRNTSTPLTKAHPLTSRTDCSSLISATVTTSPVKKVMIDISQSDDDSYDGCAEESMTVPSDTQNSCDTNAKLRQLITKDASLHKAILLYQPIWLNHFKELVRSAGLKCTIAQMVNFLDKQCITFKMGEPNAPNQPRTRKKGKKRR